MINLNIEELIRLKKIGMSDIEISKYYQNKGIYVSCMEINRNLQIYYNNQKNNLQSQFPELTDCTVLKEILMKGKTIAEYCSDDTIKAEKIKKYISRLRVIVENAKREGRKLIPDEEFLKIINILQNTEIKSASNIYMAQLSGYINKGICEKGNIDLIRYRMFDNNQDLMVYVLSGIDVIYKDYDKKVYDKIRKNYEEKVELYLGRLHKVELNEFIKENRKGNVEKIQTIGELIEER